jgi:hypothetical protein
MSQDQGFDQRVLLKNDQGFSVAICTAGDTLAIIENNYRFFLEHECDVMVSACSINVETHMNSSRTNLMKTSLISFASGYWKSTEVHHNEDSEYVKIRNLTSIQGVKAMVEGLYTEIMRYE